MCYTITTIKKGETKMFYLTIEKGKRSKEKVFSTNKERSKYILDNWDDNAAYWCSDNNLNYFEVRDFPWILET